ncbi:hypothetical protein OYC64_013408 [Pagothenia borchgrevinki]|uniref:Synaptonemal complex central element protein 3 n=1 Tax=Pagothenia borchgrevinki TaxID=8213 RepID=A0ABD2FTS8_PAGBO
MADSSALPELPQESINDALQVNKDLERVIEAVEDISLQLTWMGYDMVALRTSPELGTSMQKLEEAYNKCRAIICGDRQEPESEMQTQLRQCDLIVCVGHPDKMPPLRIHEALKQQPPA